MSTEEQRRRFRQHHQEFQRIADGWKERGYQYPPPQYPRIPADLAGLACGATIRKGTPCKLTSIYLSGRCKFHGGLSTGPKTPEGKAKCAANGRCPKRKKAESMSTSKN